MTLFENADAVTGLFYFAEPVGGHENGLSFFLFLQNQINKCVLHEKIQTCRRLI